MRYLILFLLLLVANAAVAHERTPYSHYQDCYRSNYYVAPYVYVNPFGVPTYPNIYNPMGTYNFYAAPFWYRPPYIYYPNGTVFYWAPNGLYRVR